MSATTSDSEVLRVPIAIEAEAPGRGLDLRNTWQILAGALLLPLGIAAIVLGWQGSAHGRVDQQQIPYLISGGVLGLGFVIIGGFFFWGHWLYRIYDQANVQHQEMMRQQAEFHRAMLQALTHSGLSTAKASARFEANGSDFVATASGTNYHRRDCAIVATRQGSMRAVSAKQANEMRPCRICDPLNVG